MSTVWNLAVPLLTLAAYGVGYLHKLLSLPVDSAMLSAMGEAVDQKAKVAAHSKLAEIAAHGQAIVQDLSIVRNASTNEVSTAVAPPTVPPDVIGQAVKSWLNDQKAQAASHAKAA